MNETLKKFCQEINFSLSKNQELSILNEVVQHGYLDENNNSCEKIIFDISFYSLISQSELNEFISKTKQFFQPYNVEFKISFINKNYSKERLIDLFDFYLKWKCGKTINFDNIEINFDLNNNNLNLEFNSEYDFLTFEKDKECFFDFVIFFQLDDLKISYIKKEKISHDFDSLEKQYLNQNKNEFENLNNQRHENKNFQSQQNKNNFYRSSQQKKVFKMSMNEYYDSYEKYFLLEGEIFSCEKIVTKTGTEIISLNICDSTEAINAKLFINNKNENYDWIKNGCFVMVEGEKRIDRNNQYYLQISKIEKRNNDEEINDDSNEEKRIEFSCRTSFSPMDGFISPKDFLAYAKKHNYKSIGFADFQDIQGFPEIFNESKKIGIKPIYGCTFSLIEKDHQIIFNPKKEANIKKEKYVIFDLETTSLNPRFGEIIEFGAVVVENGATVETIQFFVKPTKPISDFTTTLTGISQKMLDEQAKYSQEEAIKKIIEIFSDSTLIAHNAKFDIGYINEKMYQYNLGKVNNQIIDTLALAKYLIPTSSSYRLEVVSKKVNVNYDASIAHRADYDAQVLQRVWSMFVEELSRKSIYTFNDLTLIHDDNLHCKKHPYDIAVYAKNQAGLKELFKLVSLSCTTNYFNGPKLFDEDLKKSPNLLIGPASINSKIVDLLLTGTTNDINQEIQKWDFIGVPGPYLFSHLISRGNTTQEEIEESLKQLVIKTKKMNQIAIAIGDVRYLDKIDSYAHAIYIGTKGIDGKRHSLYKFNEKDPSYPNQSFLSTSEMKDQFLFLNSQSLIDELVVKNTNLLNDQIEENIEVIKSKLYPPKFDNSEEKLVELVYQNAHKKYGQNLPKIIDDRIKREIEPIIKYGFSVIYWISHKLVKKSNQDGYLVGSRGSVGSSIVATLANITEVNPLPPHYICNECKYCEFVENPKTTSGFDLDDKKCPNCQIELFKDGQTIPFETFLGFNADKVPDIDLNFSGDYQPIIHNEVKLMFGESHSFRAGTISTVATKTAFGFVKSWMEENQIHKSNIFVNYLANKIEGSKRTTGQHPGGIIIIPKEFDPEDFTPINYPANDITSSWKTTHFDFHAIHDNVLKLDLLGHDDPTVIRQLQKLTNIKMNQISFSDKNVMKLFSSTEPLNIKPEDINNEPTGALGIPEFGTKFVRKMLNVAKPTSFNDLINLSGLSHGTDVWNGNAEILVKQGKSLTEVISCRDDIMVYLMNKGVDPSASFQIMEKVRKGKGLTKEDEELLKKHKIENWYIDSLNKIKYMFPKAHATAYVMMAWRIAWFKIYYPLEYYASYFTVRTSVFDLESSLKSKHEIQNKLIEFEKRQRSLTEKITAKEEELIPIFEIINEMLARGFKISNIDLYKSDSTEWIIDYENKSLVPPFIALDGLGIAAAKSIIDARKEREFSSKDDLVSRTQVNKTILEKMSKLGILDNLNQTDQTSLF